MRQLSKYLVFRRGSWLLYRLRWPMLPPTLPGRRALTAGCADRGSAARGCDDKGKPKLVYAVKDTDIPRLYSGWVLWLGRTRPAAAGRRQPPPALRPPAANSVAVMVQRWSGGAARRWLLNAMLRRSFMRQTCVARIDPACGMRMRQIHVFLAAHDGGAEDLAGRHRRTHYLLCNVRR